MHRDTYCLCYRSYGPIRVFSFFDPLVAGYQKASLVSLSPLLCPFRHIEGSLTWGPSVVWYIRHIEGLPWLGSYSVDQCISHLKEHPGWGPAL